MASKKCPKCGEDNPAEAVMCWACYTPLSGQAPLGAGLAGAATAAIPRAAGAPMGVPPSNEAPAKKSIDPKVIGVGAFLLVGGVAAVMMSGMLGNSGGDATPPPVDPAAQPLADPGVAPSGPAPVVAPPIMSAPGGGGGGAAPAAVAAPFQTIASPGNFKTGTIGILMTNTSSPAGAAKFAKNQFAKNGRWTNMQVAVFTDKATADAFGEYQRDNKNAPLTAAGFKKLSDMGVWNATPAFLDSRGGQDRIYYPSQNPKAWWPNR